MPKEPATEGVGFARPVTSIDKKCSVAQNQECAALGFVFPVYLYGPPLIARRFLSSLGGTLLVLLKNTFVGTMRLREQKK